MVCSQTYQGCSLINKFVYSSGSGNRHAPIQFLTGYPYALDGFDQQIGKIAKCLLGKGAYLGFRTLREGVSQVAADNIVAIADDIFIKQVK